ncbi:ATPase [Fischerella thermalis CCMEE 5319]|nr:ATPase [Fischerella thermalis CCMEE 5319]
MTLLNKIREWINIRLYPSKRGVLYFLRRASFVIALVTLCALVINYGYKLSAQEKTLVFKIVQFSLIFYLTKYIIKIIYDFHPIQFIKETKIEALLMLLILINLISLYFFDFNVPKETGNLLNIDNVDAFFNAGIQIYFLVVFLIEFGKASSILDTIKINPSLLFIYSFLILFTIGTALLLMPEMNVTGKSPEFLDALFTSISASCVTGLTVVDTGSFWSFKGQLVILILIQLGGLNIISFATLLVLFTRNNIGLRQQSIMQNNLLADSLSSSSGLLKRIFTYTFTIELIGSVVLFSTFYYQESKSFIRGYFDALFHSISAFNNAGFSTHENGLMAEGVSTAYWYHIIIGILIIIGSLGFSNIYDILSIKKRRLDENKPWLSLKIDTRISLYASAILILSGMVVFFLVERNGILADDSLFVGLVKSFFQSVTARTAGFNTVDIGLLAAPTLILLIFLMFIGASPGSTGGGIKTNTFVLIFIGTYTIIKGRANIEIFKRTIPYDLVMKAYSIMLFAITTISIGIFLLSVFEPEFSLLQLSFEQVSAFATVGLSTGITAELSVPGKIIIMVTMFVGRIGPLTLAYSLLRESKSKSYKYPETRIMVG